MDFVVTAVAAAAGTGAGFAGLIALAEAVS
jgi:hypothetical protein